MFLQCGQVAGLCEGCETVAEVADARENDFLGGGDVGWGPDPGYCVATFLDGVDEGPDVACYVVQQVDCGHFGGLVVVYNGSDKGPSL